jgi:YidC/Oxa1 family membrane protein insertase
VKEVSDQARVALAFALALLVMVGWYFLNPPKPQPPPGSAASQAQSATALPGGVGGAGAVVQPNQPVGANSTGATALAAAAPVTATGEKDIVVESDLYRVELSNRGGVVRSWQLKKYTDGGNPPRVLDLVNADLARQTNSWPLSLQFADGQQESAANQGLYVVKASAANAAVSTDNTIAAPAQIEFHWSDGQMDVTKTLKFDRDYIMSVDTAVQQNGRPVSYSIAWRGGFGDVTAFRAAVQTLVFDDHGGSISTITSKNSGTPNQRNIPAAVPGMFGAVGIEDLYFAAAFLPPAAPAPGQPIADTLTLSTRQTTHTLQADGKTQQEILPEMAVGSTAPGPLDVRLYVGPKDIDTLKAVRPPLNGLVQFGWFGFIAEPLFYILRWIYHYIPNYGWAIVVMTIAINMVLYPLKVKSWRSMQKMQKVAPEIRQIQDRYKKYSMRDPRKQEMNKEVMAVYSREGVNPMGSCLPQVIQMPIWFGLYRMLNATIELRHAPWFGMFHDLSGRDPYFILTIIMALLMYAAQKMTPMTVTDPSQQRMMTLMPLMFVGMFFLIPVSCGLILYIVTQNIVAVLQQWHLNRTSPIKALVAPARGKKKRDSRGAVEVSSR